MSPRSIRASASDAREGLITSSRDDCVLPPIVNRVGSHRGGCAGRIPNLIPIRNHPLS